MLPEKMLILNPLRRRHRIAVNLSGQDRHFGNLLQNNAMVNRLCCILAPGKGAVTAAHNGGNIAWVHPPAAGRFQ